MIGSARRARTPIAILASLMLALLLFAGVGVGQAQATSNAYTLQSNFPGGACSGLHNSGQRDGLGNVYVPCGNPSTVRVFDAKGTLTKTIPLGFYATDVAPSWDGQVLYAAQYRTESAPGAGDGAAIAIRRLVKDVNGNFAVNETGWSLKTYTKNGGTYKAKGGKIATDSKGHLYVSDGAGGNTNVQGDEVSTIVKHDAAGNVVTHFGGTAKNGAGGPFHGLLGGIAVSDDGNRVYAVEGNNPAGTAGNKGNHLFRFDKQAGSQAYTEPRKWGGDTVAGEECVWRGDLGQAYTAWNPDYFAAPWDVGVDADENVYVVSASCFEVVKFDSEFNFRAGMKIGGLTTEPFNQGRPHGIAVSAAGEVYVGQANAKMDLASEAVRPTSTVAPASGAEGVGVGGNVTATFPEPMMPGVMTFVLKNAAGTEVASAVSYDKATKTATLNPNADLAAGATYTATLTGAMDHWGNLADPDPKTWTFKTAGGVTPPGTCLDRATTRVVENDNNANTISGIANTADVVDARGGDDTFQNISGDANLTDRFCGGDGNDTFNDNLSGGGMAILDGGNGSAGLPDNHSDTVSYAGWNNPPAGTTSGVDVRLALQSPYTTGGGHAEAGGTVHALYNISDVEGSHLNDVLEGSNLNNSLYGNDGTDRLTGLAGFDYLSGGDGNDIINAADGVRDRVDCGPGTDQATVDPVDEVINCEPDAVKPVITPLSPKPAAVIYNRTPTIKAKVSDNVTDPAKGDIELYRGTTLIPSAAYSYDTATNVLGYKSSRLPYGKNTFRIEATDEAQNVGVKSWSFTVKRR